MTKAAVMCMGHTMRKKKLHVIHVDKSNKVVCVISTEIFNSSRMMNEISSK